MPEEAWMLAEIVVFAMFKNEHAACLQQVAFQYQIGDVLEFLQCVWGVGKDKVVGCRAAAYIAEYIVSYNTPCCIAK